jgi:Outer membrane protein beta-barrel family
LNKKGNVKLAVTDVLNMRQQRISSVYPRLAYELKQKHETRVFRLNFSYNFGNSQVVAARNKNTGLEDENSRLKSVSK